MGEEDDVLLFHASQSGLVPTSPLHHAFVESIGGSRSLSVIDDTSSEQLVSSPVVDDPLFYEDGEIIEQSWNWVFILLAYVVAFIGSYAAIRLLEHGLWRSERERQNATSVFTKYPMFSTAFVIGSCTIWSMHFIGMQAVTLQYDSDLPLHSDYDWGQTFASLLLAITGVWMGLMLASRDIFSGADRVDKLREFLQHDPVVTSKVNRKKANRHIHIVALFYQLHWIVVGSVFVALGALSMHYLGMYAMKGPFRKEWSVGYIIASIIVGVIVGFAGIWILFRPLHWKVEKGWYRYCSAMVIALAVCALHFLGMQSVTYIADSTQQQAGDGTSGAIGAWKADQLLVVCVCIAVPFIAFYVEHTICNELRMTYHQLLNIQLSGSALSPNNSHHAAASSSVAGSVLSANHRIGGSTNGTRSRRRPKHPTESSLAQRTLTRSLRISGISFNQADPSKDSDEANVKGDMHKSWSISTRRGDWNRVIYSFRKRKSKDDNKNDNEEEGKLSADIESGEMENPHSFDENCTQDVTRSVSGPSTAEEEPSTPIKYDEGNNELTRRDGQALDTPTQELEEEVLFQQVEDDMRKISMMKFQKGNPSFKDVLSTLPTLPDHVASSTSHSTTRRLDRNWSSSRAVLYRDTSSHHTGRDRLDRSHRGSGSSNNNHNGSSRRMGNDSSSKHGVDERQRRLNQMFDHATPSMRYLIDTLNMDRVEEDSSSPVLGHENEANEPSLHSFGYPNNEPSLNSFGYANEPSLHSFGYDIDSTSRLGLDIDQSAISTASKNDKGDRRGRRKSKDILDEFRDSSLKDILKDVGTAFLEEQSISSVDYDEEESSSNCDTMYEPGEIKKSLEGFGKRVPSLEDFTAALAKELEASQNTTSDGNHDEANRHRLPPPRKCPEELNYSLEGFGKRVPSLEDFTAALAKELEASHSSSENEEARRQPETLPSSQLKHIFDV